VKVTYGNGVTWATVDLGTASTQNPVGIAYGNGFWIVVHQSRDDNHEIYYQTATLPGGPWSAPATVAGANAFSGPSVAYADFGVHRFVLTWIDRDSLVVRSAVGAPAPSVVWQSFENSGWAAHTRPSTFCANSDCLINFSSTSFDARSVADAEVIFSARGFADPNLSSAFKFHQPRPVGGQVERDVGSTAKAGSHWIYAYRGSGGDLWFARKTSSSQLVDYDAAIFGTGGLKAGPAIVHNYTYSETIVVFPK
jgi:hypothetical protein